jgi:hypothetical protein
MFKNRLNENRDCLIAKKKDKKIERMGVSKKMFWGVLVINQFQ